MARLPMPGGDQDIWGDVLNDFLGQVHNADGTLKDGTVNSSTLSTSLQSNIGQITGKASSGSNSDITSLSGLTTPLSVVQGGTGAGSAQLAINTLSGVSSATNEYVLTKDTASGNAIFKSPPSNINEQTFTITNTLIVVAGAPRWYAPYNLTITQVRASVATAPTGASIIVDVNKNGTTIFTTQSNRPTISASGNTALAAAIDVSSLTAGDYLTVDVDQIGSTIAGSDLTVTIRYTVG